MKYKALNLSDLDFGLSRPFKVKYDGAIGLPIYASLLMFNSNIWPNSVARDIRHRNLSDLDFDLSSSLKVNLTVLLDSPYVVSF